MIAKLQAALCIVFVIQQVQCLRAGAENQVSAGDSQSPTAESCAISPSVLNDKFFRHGRQERILHLPGDPLPETVEHNEGREGSSSVEAHALPVDGPRDCVPFRVEPSLEIGLGDKLPKSYYLQTFPQSKEWKPIAYLPFLRINTDGTASLALYLTPNTTKELHLSDLDDVTSKEIFGTPANSRTDEVTFHMIGWDKTEPNIFHVDFVFGSNRHVTKYKIRGFRISQPKWRLANK